MKMKTCWEFYLCGERPSSSLWRGLWSSLSRHLSTYINWYISWYIRGHSWRLHQHFTDTSPMLNLVNTLSAVICDWHTVFKLIIAKCFTVWHTFASTYICSCALPKQRWNAALPSETLKWSYKWYQYIDLNVYYRGINLPVTWSDYT